MAGIGFSTISAHVEHIVGQKSVEALQQDLRRSNFTSADARNANFKGTKLQGAYFIKAVTANANFEV